MEISCNVFEIFDFEKPAALKSSGHSVIKAGTIWQPA